MNAPAQSSSPGVFVSHLSIKECEQAWNELVRWWGIDRSHNLNSEAGGRRVCRHPRTSETNASALPRQSQERAPHVTEHIREMVTKARGRGAVDRAVVV